LRADSLSPAVTYIVVASVLFGFGCVAWLFWQRHQFEEHLDRLRIALRLSHIALKFRDAVMDAGSESVVVLAKGAEVPQNFGNGTRFLQMCLAGPDAFAFATAVKRLLDEGKPFRNLIRSTEGWRMMVRGRQVGRRAAIYFRLDGSANKRRLATGGYLSVNPPDPIDQLFAAHDRGAPRPSRALDVAGASHQVLLMPGKALAIGLSRHTRLW
jgi:hypothetical protein